MHLSQSPFYILFVGQDNPFWQRCREVLSAMNESFLIESYPNLDSVIKAIKKGSASGLLFLNHPDKNWTCQALRDIKSEAICAGIASVVCVPENNEDDIEDAFKSGANIVLTMQDSENELVESLEDLIGQMKQFQLFNFQKDTFLIMR